LICLEILKEWGLGSSIKNISLRIKSIELNVSCKWHIVQVWEEEKILVLLEKNREEQLEWRNQEGKCYSLKNWNKRRRVMFDKRTMWTSKRFINLEEIIF